MAIRGNITLTDAAATPVNHVFYPTKSKGDVLSWSDRTQAVVLGQPVLTCSQRVADKQTNATKIVWKLETPILADTSGGTSGGYAASPKVAYTLLSTLDLVFPAASTQQQRKDVLAMMRDLIDEAIVTAQAHDLDMVW